MIKILILFAIAVLTTFAGVLLSAEKKKRMEIYSELYEFNELLLLNMKFGREELGKLTCGFTYMGDLLEGKLLLNGDDGKFLDSYIKNLGQTDAASQIDYLNERKIYLKKYKDDSYADYKKYSSLYIKIFFLSGILIAVLLA